MKLPWVSRATLNLVCENSDATVKLYQSMLDRARDTHATEIARLQQAQKDALEVVLVEKRHVENDRERLRDEVKDLTDALTEAVKAIVGPDPATQPRKVAGGDERPKRTFPKRMTVEGLRHSLERAHAAGAQSPEGEKRRQVIPVRPGR